MRRRDFIKPIEDIQEMQEEAGRLLRNGAVIVLVPTMGYLHEGHLTLIREGRKRGDILIVSIFVNPIQFGPTEDLDSYPRDLKRDFHLAESVGADIVFVPETRQMYTKGYQTFVDLAFLPNHLCGLSRPGHFRGVATVVTKLFNIVRPQIAVFGEKDYQQLTIIRQMVRDLNMNIEIVGVPTVRETDGLAMSSRNSYLSDKKRDSALSLSRGLRHAQKRLSEGIRDARTLTAETGDFIGSHPWTKTDYIVLCDPATLEAVEQVDRPTLMALAVWVGKTRLIDNAILTPPAG